MACWLYEGMLLFAVVFVAGWLFSTLGQMRHALDDRRWLLQGFLFVVLGVYFVYFWSHGQTLAMKTWRIRIVGPDGRSPRQRRALLRYLLAWMWLLPPLALAQFFGGGGVLLLVTSLWVIVWALLTRTDRERQFLHDRWAGTRLVDAADRR